MVLATLHQVTCGFLVQKRWITGVRYADKRLLSVDIVWTEKKLEMNVRRPLRGNPQGA
jgi:hypothetical protein